VLSPLQRGLVSIRLEYQAPPQQGLPCSQFFSRKSFYALTSTASRTISPWGPRCVPAAQVLSLNSAPAPHLPAGSPCSPSSATPTISSSVSQKPGELPRRPGPQSPCMQRPQTGHRRAEPTCKWLRNTRSEDVHLRVLTEDPQTSVQHLARGRYLEGIWRKELVGVEWIAQAKAQVGTHLLTL